MKTIFNSFTAILLLLCSGPFTAPLMAQTNGTTGNWDLNGNSGTNGTNFIGTLDGKSFRIKTNNAVRLTITSGGKTGLGITAPVFKLDVKGGSINTDSVYRIGGRQVLSSGAANTIQLGDAGALVGIGTAAPVKTLDVTGSGNVTAYIHSTGGPAAVIIERADSNATSMMEFRNTGGGLGSQTWRAGIAQGANDYVINASSFSGNAITVLRSNGNVGIGTGNPQARLEVNGTLRIPGGFDGQVLTFEAASGNAVWKNAPAGGSGGLSGGGQATRLAFWNGISSLSSSSNLYWDSTNFRLGIGTSSPATALEVNGQIKINGGSPGNGKVLTSDANGLASWQTISGGGVLSGSGTTGQHAFWNGTFTMTSTSDLFYNTAAQRLGIGSTSPNCKLQVSGGTTANIGSGGYIMCGEAVGNNLIMDGFKIQARNNINASSNLFLNPLGSYVAIGASTTPSARLHVFGGSDAALASGGYFILGTVTGTNLVMDENEIMSRNNGSTSTLTLQNNGGNLIIDGTGSGSMVGIGTGSPSYQLQLSTNSAGKPGSSSWTVVSDARLKKNVSGFSDGLSLVTKMNPVRYNYSGEAGMPANEQFVGLMAQDLQEIAPYMVKEWTHENENGNGKKQNYLSVDYGAMDFILINAIREQQQQLEMKEEKINGLQKSIAVLQQKFTDMEQALSRCCTTFNTEVPAEKESIQPFKNARLEQNMPNPFTEKTIIRYYIPSAAVNAVLKIYALDGREMKSIPLETTGYGETTLAGRSLTAGTYTYLLLVNGIPVDSKQMILQN